MGGHMKKDVPIQALNMASQSTLNGLAFSF